MSYEEAIKSAPVVFVEFFATWCPHCQRMMPIIDQVRELLGEQVPVYQLDIEQNQELAQQNDVESIPTMIIYKDGSEVWRHTGEMDGNDLLAQIQSYL